MNLARRQFLGLAAGALALPTAPHIASAQTYPARPLRLVVGYSAGGVSDILARLIGQSLSERLLQPVVIENKPGASSNIATESVAHAAPDGYTLILDGVANAINASLYDNLSFSFTRDIAPVALVASGPMVMEVHPSVPARTVPEFIAYAKANPGRINMASAGTGGGTHVAGELFSMMAGIKMVHVPYHGSPPALADLLAGQVQVMFDNMASSVELIRAGRLRALAVSTTTRSDALPDLPLIADVLPGYQASGWNGIGAPKGTPPDVIEKLNGAINAVLTDARVKTSLANLGSSPGSGSAADFGRFIAEDTERWAKVVKFAGIKPE